jgi:hypothetical protein
VPYPAVPGYPPDPNDPPLGTYPTIPAGYRTPLPGSRPSASSRRHQASSSLTGQGASSRRSRWLIPAVAAATALLVAALFAFWQLSRDHGNDPGQGQATTIPSTGGSAAANVPPAGGTHPNTVTPLNGTVPVPVPVTPTTGTTLS